MKPTDIENLEKLTEQVVYGFDEKIDYDEYEDLIVAFKYGKISPQDLGSLILLVITEIKNHLETNEYTLEDVNYKSQPTIVLLQNIMNKVEEVLNAKPDQNYLNTIVLISDIYAEDAMDTVLHEMASYKSFYAWAERKLGNTSYFKLNKNKISKEPYDDDIGPPNVHELANDLNQYVTFSFLYNEDSRLWDHVILYIAKNKEYDIITFLNYYFNGHPDYYDKHENNRH